MIKILANTICKSSFNLHIHSCSWLDRLERLEQYYWRISNYCFGNCQKKTFFFFTFYSFPQEQQKMEKELIFAQDFKSDTYTLVELSTPELVETFELGQK
jgi:hypothetical protein